MVDTFDKSFHTSFCDIAMKLNIKQADVLGHLHKNG